MAITYIDSITPFQESISLDCAYNNDDDILPLLYNDNIEFIFNLTSPSTVSQIKIGWICCDKVHHLIDLTEESENYSYEVVSDDETNFIYKVTLIKPYQWIECDEFKLFANSTTLNMPSRTVVIEQLCDIYLCEICDVPLVAFCFSYYYSVATFRKTASCDICDTILIEKTDRYLGSVDLEYTIKGRIAARLEKPQYKITRGFEYRKTNGQIVQKGMYKTAEYELKTDYYSAEMHNKISDLLNFGTEIKINGTSVLGAEEYEIDWIDKVDKAQATEIFKLKQNRPNVC